jgi:hypothetical protein
VSGDLAEKRQPIQSESPLGLVAGGLDRLSTEEGGVVPSAERMIGSKARAAGDSGIRTQQAAR